MLSTLKKYLADTSLAHDMYITGQAGTGKTTGLRELVQYCIDANQDYMVCAFTHKACGILRSKLPANAKVRTLHSYLKKRPTINQEAHDHSRIERSVVTGEADLVPLLFVDEYSMVGEQDLMDIRAIEPAIKVVWLGDSNQLPPVGDIQAIEPYGPYTVTLTHVYRQEGDNPLLGTLQQLVSFIEGAPASELKEHSSFHRNQDLVKSYQDDAEDKILLAYTNAQVEALNASVQGRDEPEAGDKVYSPTTKETYEFKRWLEPHEVSYIMPGFGDPITLGTRFKTLEFLLTQGYQFAELNDEIVVACQFGHGRYKQLSTQLKRAAAGSNAAIGKDAGTWARKNPNHKKSKERAKAWRSFLSFNEAVICLDFTHAVTVHKSQGSTYKSVYLDTQDLAIAADINYTLYLKLMYVALSRASATVVTN